jgi:outer membrane receptor protein involved in Fe transport
MWQKKDSPFSGFIDRNLNEGYVTQNYIPEPRTEEFSQVALTVDYDFPIARLTSVTGRYDRDYRWTQDTTAFISSTYGKTDAGGIASVAFLDFDFTTKITSEELRLTSARGSRIDWILGAAYLEEHREQGNLWSAPTQNENASSAHQIPGGLIQASLSQNGFRSMSFFADVTFKMFDEHLQLSVGARQFEQRFDQHSQSTGALPGAVGEVIYGVPRSGKESGVNPRAAIKYSFEPGRMIYASVAKGFRAGGPGAAPANLQTAACLDALQKAGLEPGGTFESDKVLSYELGSKTTLAGGRAALDVAAFYVDWSDLQTNLILNIFNVGCPGTATGNLGLASTKGLEVSFTANPFDRLSINTAASYTEATLGKQPLGVTTSKAGDQLQNAPKWQATLGLQYEFPLAQTEYGGFVRGDVSYYGWQISNQSQQNDPFFYVPARTMVNLRFGVHPADSNWSSELYVDNALDRNITYGAQGFFGEPFTNQALVGRPRTVGLLLRKNW